MREQFFGSKGLTSTSANHVANMAKEFIQTQKTFLSHLCFVNETKEAGGNKYETGVATPVDQFNNIEVVISKIASATQLIAWLREALKEKQNAIANISSFDVYLKNVGKQIPESPYCESYITEADVIRTWDVNKYNAYLTAQTYAAVYGESIHPDSAYSNARKALTDVLSTPHSVTGSGRDLTVTTRTAAYEQEAVDKKFFALQEKQREYQAKFNQYQHEITTAIDNDKAVKDAAYTKAYQDYRNQIGVLNAEYTEWRNKTNKELADLKIVVPESLTAIYNEISGLGK